MPNGAEREFETGKDEAWFAKVNRDFETYSEILAAQARRSQEFFDSSIKSFQAITNQILSNMVSTSDMVAKQAVRHSDLAIDRQWNIDEVASLVARSETFRDAIAAAVAEAVQKVKL